MIGAALFILLKWLFKVCNEYRKDGVSQIIDTSERLCQTIKIMVSNKIKLDDINTFKCVLNAAYAKWRNDKTHVEVEWLKKP